MHQGLPAFLAWTAALVLLSGTCCSAQSTPPRQEPQQSASDPRGSFEKGDYAAAFQQWHQQAREGDGEAQFWVMSMFQLGWGTPSDNFRYSWWAAWVEAGRADIDFAHVKALLQPVAVRGEAHAQALMGIMAISGLGAPKDPREAQVWFKQAAEQGEPFAQFALGQTRQTGDGIKRDLEEAARWYRESSARGCPMAMHELGRMFLEGNGQKKDPMEAYKWYLAGADKADGRCQYQVGWMHQESVGVTKSPTEALKWYLLAAGRGFPAAQIHLGDFFRDGGPVAPDPVAAYRWYGLALFYGRLLTREAHYNYALDEFQKAGKRLSSAQRGQALHALGKLCMNGDQVPPSDMAALVFVTASLKEETTASEREGRTRELEALRTRLTPWECARMEYRLRRWPAL